MLKAIGRSVLKGVGKGVLLSDSKSWSSYWLTRTPSGLTATVISDTRIDLSWTNNGVLDYTGVSIERSTDGVTYSEITTVVLGVAAYPSEGLTEGTKYYYRIRAYKDTQYSPYSNVVNDTTTLLAPSSLALTIVSNTQINLAFTVNSTNRDGHSIERSTDGVNYAEIITVLGATATYNNTGLSANYYYYRVRAYKGAVYSSYCSVAMNDVPLCIYNTAETLMWYDYTSGITMPTPPYVGTWADKLGSGRNLLQAGADSLKPTLTADGVLFDGANDRLRTDTFAMAQPTFLYFVFRQKTWTATDRLLDGYLSAKGQMQQSGVTPQLLVAAGSASSALSIDLDKWCVGRILFNGANSKFLLDAQSTSGSYGANAMDGLSLGASGGTASAWGNVEFKEVIVRNLTDAANEADIYNYLAIKYGDSFSITSTGDGTGVGTLKLTVSSDITLSFVYGSGKFYDDAAGTINEGTSHTITAGAERTVYVKTSAGTSTMYISDISKITSIGGWASSTNAPSLGGDISEFVELTKIDIQGNNTISGDIDDLADLTYIDLRGSNVVKNYTSGKTWADNQNTVKIIQASGSGFSATEIDNILIDLANVTNWTGAKVIYLPHPNNARTSASDAAVTTLEGKSVTITLNEWIPMIAFMDDDGTSGSYTYTKGLLEGYGWKASFGIITGRVDTAGCMTSAQVQECAADGHEITSHSVTHPHYNITPEADVIDELADSKAFLEGLGLTIRAHTSPYGDNSPRCTDNVLTYYEALFAGLGGDPVNELPVNVRTGIGRVNIDVDTATTMKTWVDQLIADAGASVLLFYGHAWSWDATQKTRIVGLLDYIQTKGLTIIGAMDIVDKIKTYNPVQWTDV